jgi:hypothetical protein
MKKRFFWIFISFCGFSTQFPITMSKGPSLCSAKFLSQEDSKFANRVFVRCEKNSFSHFKRYNLTMYVVNFFEAYSTPFFNNPKQDPMVKSRKRKFKNQFM